MIDILNQNCNYDTKYHQHKREHFKITHKSALLSQISPVGDFYVIRESSPSVEGLTAYRFLAVPAFILLRRFFISKHILYLLNCLYTFRDLSYFSI